MDLRKITDDYAVSPQLQPADMATLAEQGITTVICNRPDAEKPTPAAGGRDAGGGGGCGPRIRVQPGHGRHADRKQRGTSRPTRSRGSEGPVVAYCASGNRSTIVWALGVAGEVPVDDILGRATANGYDLAWLRPQLEALCRPARRMIPRAVQAPRP